MKKLLALFLFCALLLSGVPVADAGAVDSGSAGKVTPMIVSGYHFSAALDENGTVWTWGRNESGQLGDGTNTDRHYAAPVPGLTHVVKIAAASRKMMALQADGTLWAWGDNNLGDLGLGYNIPGYDSDVPSPEKVQLPNDSGVKDFALASQSSVVLMEDGTVWSWGTIPRLHGAAVEDEEAYHVVELDGLDITAVAGACYNQNAFLFLTGSGTQEDPSRLFCWSYLDEYYPIEGDFDSRVPTEITFPGSEFITDIDASYELICLVVGGEEPGVYCWGDNSDGQVGTGSDTPDFIAEPHKLSGYHTSPPISISSDSYSTVALHEDGTLWLWGSDSILTEDMPGLYPFVAQPTRLPIDHIASVCYGSSWAMLALRQDGIVYARGNNLYGQLGRPEDYGTFTECEFDLKRPVLKEDGTPLALFTTPQSSYFLTRQLDTLQGSIQGSSSGAYAPGSQITLTAQPWEGYLFTGWQAEGVTLPDPEAPAITFPMPAGDVTITALFEKDWPGMEAGGAFQGEIGAPEVGAIPISTAEELAAIGTDSAYPLDGSYVLTADLDLSGYEAWIPIGGEDTPFSGTFDGQGHVISGLTYTGEDTYVGLFGRINELGQVKNLGLEQVSIQVTGGYDDYYVGGIVGQLWNGYSVSSQAEISNCYVTGTIDADLGYGSTLYLGGIAGELGADARDCFNLASLTGTIGSTYGEALYLGGIAGRIPEYLSDPYIIERCFNAGSLTPSCQASSLFAGGITGYLDIEVILRQCYNTADLWVSPGYVYGRNAYLGGIAGVAYATPENCYNLGDVGADSSNSNAYWSMTCGGIVGQFVIGDHRNYTLSTCYNTGSVIARAYGNSNAGGIVGNVERNSYYFYTKSCVVLSPEISAYKEEIQGSTGSSGPFQADVMGNNVTGSSSNYNYYRRGIASHGYSSLKTAGASAVAEASIHTQSWFEDSAKWKFTQVWSWDETAEGGLPRLAWQMGGSACLLLDYDGRQIRVYCQADTPFAALCAASYGEDGQLLDLALVQCDLTAGINSLSLPLEELGDVCRVFLWRSTNCKPLSPSLRMQ